MFHNIFFRIWSNFRWSASSVRGSSDSRQTQWRNRRWMFKDLSRNFQCDFKSISMNVHQFSSFWIEAWRFVLELIIFDYSREFWSNHILQFIKHSLLRMNLVWEYVFTTEFKYNILHVRIQRCFNNLIFFFNYIKIIQSPLKKFKLPTP